MTLTDLSMGDAILYYALLALGVLVLILVVGVFYQRSHNWQLTRLQLHTCENCGLVFAVGRFHRKHTKVTCPRCRMRQQWQRERPRRNVPQV